MYSPATTPARLDAIPPPAASAESELIHRARGGDRAAFGELHDKYIKMVNAIVLSRARASDAPDLVQEVFTRALTNIQRLRSGESAGAWLAGIARNVAIDSHRARRPAAELKEEPAQRSAPRSAAEDANEILLALHAIPETYRESLLMRLVEGMTGPEIADRTGLTAGSVRVHLHRGMQMLREELARRELIS